MILRAIMHCQTYLLLCHVSTSDLDKGRSSGLRLWLTAYPGSQDSDSSNVLTILSILPIPNLCASIPPPTWNHLNSLAVLGQLLLCALLTALPDGPSELVSLGGIFISRQDLGVLSSLNLDVSFVVLSLERGRTVSMKWFISVW